MYSTTCLIQSLIAIVIILPISHSFAQTSTEALKTTRSDVRAAGARYKAGGFKKLILGGHYRDEWTTPVEIPILDLSQSAGGLTPIKKSGGGQSKSLSFKAANGSRFMFRSVDKDPSQALPTKLRGTILADAVQDGISTAHPYGALVVPPLAGAVGVLHTNPKLVVLPDDDRLGAFREEFAGVVGMIEEFVIHGPDGAAGFAGFKRIIGMDELLKELEESFDDAVDQKAYLKARLLDIYISDWDRHFDQWRWGRAEKDGKKIWHPIPLDRDQALVTFGGLLPKIAENRYIIPQFEGLEKDSPDIWSLTYQARHSDRIFLNALTLAEFQQVSAEFASQLTDEVIEEAVGRLPEPIYEISGRMLEEKLKERRKLIGEAAVDFYKNLASHVEIVGRNKSEYVAIDRFEVDHLDVQIFERDGSTGEKKGDAVYHRVCHRDETKEIRLYLLGGNDKVVITGEADKSILLRIIGGEGDDEFIDESRGKTIVYDTRAKTKVVKGRRTTFKSGRVDFVINAHEYKPKVRSHGKLVWPIPHLSVNSDDGIVLGAGTGMATYGFRKTPYAKRLSIRGNYASKSGAIRLRFNGNFVDTIFGVGLGLEIETDPHEITNYYGLGNATQRDANLEADDFYRVQGVELLLKPTLRKNLSPNSAIAFGGTIKRFATDLEIDERRFVKEEKPAGVEIANLVELNAGATVDLRDHPVSPKKGAFLGAGVSLFPKTLDNENSFAKGEAFVRFYFSPIRDVTFAFRAGGEKVWGTFPYYEAAYIGGSSLRAFRSRRFGGDTSAFGSAELRFKLFRPVILLPTDLGLFFFGEAGRVWLDGDSPDDWHTSVGGGLSFAPIYRSLTFSIGAANSTEGVRLTLNGGFVF